MPRVNLTRKSQYEKKLNYLRGNLVGGLDQRYITSEDIANEFNVNLRTAQKWKLHPERCSFETIIKLYLMAGIDLKAPIEEEL